MIVVDSSVVVDALVDEAAAAQVRSRMRDSRMIAPHLLDVEVLSALRRLRRASAIEDVEASAAIASLMRLGIERWAHRPLLDGMWQVRDNISAYDAAYVSLAMTMGATLITGDGRLARAAEHWCDVELLSAAD